MWSSVNGPVLTHVVLGGPFPQISILTVRPSPPPASVRMENLRDTQNDLHNSHIYHSCLFQAISKTIPLPKPTSHTLKKPSQKSSESQLLISQSLRTPHRKPFQKSIEPRALAPHVTRGQLSRKIF